MKFSIDDSSSEEDEGEYNRLSGHRTDDNNKNNKRKNTNKNIETTNLCSTYLPQNQKASKNDRNKNQAPKSGVLGAIFPSSTSQKNRKKIPGGGETEYSKVEVQSDDDYERVDRGRDRGSGRDGREEGSEEGGAEGTLNPFHRRRKY